ncbi:MAG TPA: hypothetical protein VNB90_08550 [Cytophagaceae bacterium]|nr:hypothetical protein [Cytophagaceae bacterium]
MLAYSSQHIDNSAIQHHAKKWQKHGLLSSQTYEAIKAKYPHSLYSPNLFVRLGLFIFTAIGLLAGGSYFIFITAGFDSATEVGFGVRLLITGLMMFGVLEGLIKQKDIFRAGSDDALLYSAIGCMVSGLTLLFYQSGRSDENELLLYCLIAIPFLVLGTIRYMDTLSAAGFFICVFLIIFILISKLGEISKLIMPFLVMILSALSYFTASKYRAHEKFRFWEMPLMILEILSLVLFYMAGNYFIVRTLSEELFRMQLTEGEDIPLAFFFYAYTAIIPMAYVFYGLKNKNRVLLQTGLVLVAAAVLTFKYYFSLGHHEITLTISGVIMILIAWLSIRFLKTPKYGITFEEDSDEKILDKFDAEALIIAQSFSSTHAPAQDGVEMGGGNFGGGGASSDF